MAFPERWLIWLIALVASLDAVGQAIQGFIDGRSDRVLLWVAISGSILLGTVAADILKSRRDA